MWKFIVNIYQFEWSPFAGGLAIDMVLTSHTLSLHEMSHVSVCRTTRTPLRSRFRFRHHFVLAYHLLYESHHLNSNYRNLIIIINENKFEYMRYKLQIYEYYHKIKIKIKKKYMNENVRLIYCVAFSFIWTRREILLLLVLLLLQWLLFNNSYLCWISSAARSKKTWACARCCSEAYETDQSIKSYKVPSF